MIHRLSILMLAAVAAAGCNAPLAEDPGPTALGEHLVGPARQPAPIADGAALSPLREGTWTYRFIDAEKAGQTARLRLEKVDDPEAPWRRHAPDYQQVRHLSADGEGGLRLHVVVDIGRDAITRFEPALPVLLTDLKPNEPVTNTAQTTVTRHTNPDRQLATGESSMTLTLDGEQKVKTPAGTFDTKRIKIEYTADLSFAKVNSVTWAYYAKGIGIVAEHHDEQTVVVMFPKHRERTIVLTDYPE